MSQVVLDKDTNKIYIYLLKAITIYKITKVAASRLCKGYRCYENNTSEIQISNANTNVYFCQAYSIITSKYNIGVGKYANNVSNIVISPVIKKFVM